MTRANVVRFPYRLAKADLRALDELEREYDEMAVAGRWGPEGERQVRTASGEIYNLEMLRSQFSGRRGTSPDDLPPAPAAAKRAA